MSLDATCATAIQCHGAQCFTTPSVLPNSTYPAHRRARVTWDPCLGQPFTYQINYSFEQGYDFANVYSGGQLFAAYTGDSNGYTSPYSVPGPVDVETDVDWSGNSQGIIDLEATCADWTMTP